MRRSTLTTDFYVYGQPHENEIINQHPWILSRGDMILNSLKKRELVNFADIGVDDMFYTKKLKSFAKGNVYAVDILFPEEGIIKDGIICVNDIKKLPENEIDCLVMMDVLEHIKDDNIFFNDVINKLKEGGTILITVPAWQFLFSQHDVRAQHFRRYNRKQLLNLLTGGDIEIEECHYFYTSLFLVRTMLLFKKDKFTKGEWNYSERHIMTKTFRIILNIDFFLNKLLNKIFVHLPGLSLYAICKKK